MTGKDIGPIVSEIVTNEKKIIRELKKHKEDFDVYRFLRKEYNKEDILNNSVFQFVYRNHYKLEGRLTESQKRKFFKLMAQKENDLNNLLIELNKSRDKKKNKHSIQFSFSTKLIHFLDIDEPIWDYKVDKALNLEFKNIKIKSKDPKEFLKEKIHVCITTYGELEDIYSKLLPNKDVLRIIKKVREEAHLEEETFSKTKVLDSILWALGDIKDN